MTNYGEKPTKFMDVFQQVMYTATLDKIHAQKLDDEFQEKKAREQSTKLARVSAVIVGITDLVKIILKSPPGTQVIIDADTGRVFRGKISESRMAKFQELPKKVPGRKSLEIDADLLPEMVASRSWVFAPGNPMKHVWESRTMKAPKVSGNPVIWLFEKKLEKTPADNVTRKFFTDSLDYKYVEISIKDFPFTIGMNLSTNKIRYYLYKGKKTEI